MAWTGSPLAALTPCVAPKRCAKASLSSLRSTAMIGYAPTIWAAAMAHSPTPPAPNTATDSFTRTPRVLRITPAPVSTAQPIIDVTSVATSWSRGTTTRSESRVYSVHGAGPAGTAWRFHCTCTGARGEAPSPAPRSTQVVMTWSPSCTWVTWWPLATTHTGCLMPQQRGTDGRCTAVRGLGRAVDLVQLGVTDTAGKEFDQHLIRLRIGEGDVIDDQWRIRFNEDSGFGARRHGVPLRDLVFVGAGLIVPEKWPDAPVAATQLGRWLSANVPRSAHVHPRNTQ